MMVIMRAEVLAVGDIVTYESGDGAWRRQLEVTALNESGEPVYQPVVEK